MKRHIYLEDIPLPDARAALQEALVQAGLAQPLPAERIPVARANGRVTAKAIFARISSPHYHASAMDGYAVRAQDTVGATETKPVRLRILGRGQEAQEFQRPAAGVNTGHALPGWANAVVMIEHAQPVTLASGAPGLEIRAAVPPWQHVRPMGEDMVATELVLPANHKLRPVDLGALAGSGHSTVEVYRQPRVAIIPTGSELVPLEEDLNRADAAEVGPGRIIEYNSIVLAAQVSDWGGLPTRWPIIPDEFAAIKEAVRAAVGDHDLILVNAGSSAGSEDYTAHVVEELGRLLVHGIAVRPGHPVIMGMIPCLEGPRTGQEFPVIGVPGYPVSAALTGEILVEPLLAQWQGRPPYQPPTVAGTLTRKVVSPTGDDDYVRVSVGRVGDRVMVTPISRGAGVITSLVRADGIMRIPRFSEGRQAGDEVTVHLYRTPREIERTVVAIGSHDLTLDLLAQFLTERQEDAIRLMSANVGSLGGLLALRRGEAHLAGSHLLDPATGVYNDSYILRYLEGQEIVVVGLVGREQGWIVPAGNPQGLSGWGDAANAHLQFVNRQRGAGTRLLLEYELGRLGIDPTTMRGFAREEYTHLAVAAAVASGSADAGLGIRAAAHALGLDFVPLAHEQYELVIPASSYANPLVRALLALLEDGDFKAAVAALPGYDVRPMGQVRTIVAENPAAG